MIVLPWEKDRAQVVASAMRDVVTQGVSGADLSNPLITASQLPADMDLQARLAAYGMLSALNVHEPWIAVGSAAVPFLNGCSNYGAGNRPVQFRKENGRIFIRGLVAGAGINTVIFNLPFGYRPSIHENCTMSAEGLHANLVVPPTGGVHINIATSTTPQNYASFAGVTFFPD